MINATISVLVITYNQQDCINRTLDSIIIQNQWGLGEIVISDDSSSDGTWDILLKYANSYPSIIKVFRNKENLGIYSNLEKILSLRGDYDLYTITGGDDSVCDGWFEQIQFFINNNNIALNESFTIYSDWKNITQNNQEYIIKNNYITKDLNTFSLKTRQLISNRSTLISKKTINKFKSIDLSRGLAVSEELFDYQLSLYSDKNYYCPYIGTIYFSGIGISTTLQSIEYRKEEILKWRYLINELQYNKKDKYYILFKINSLNFMNELKLRDLVLAINYYLLSIVWAYKRQTKADLIKLIGMIKKYIKKLINTISF